ncbi:MAG: DNA polymerase/3'-5' exonuclease PolX [Firmicutes bacterium]|nr:DNA polymerase/3'-5' exonuclease PolX [Bacillota bacterium]
MNNLALARAFFEIADLMELNGENPFRANAYRRAARAIEMLPEDVGEVFERGEIQTVPGIGAALAEKIGEWLDTREVKYLNELRQKVPPGVVEMTKIAGVGPKMARRFYAELGIASIDELERACRKRQIRTLRGMGARTEWNIIRGIQALRERGHQIPLGVALPVVREMQAHLEVLPQVEQVDLAGDLRRRRELLDKLDLVVSSIHPEEILNILPGLAEVDEILARDGNSIRLRLKSGPELEILVAAPESYWWILWKATGSPEHVAEVLALAREQGLAVVDEMGSELGAPLTAISGEGEFYQLLGLPFIPPEIREGKGEIDAARLGLLPQLLDLSDIRGDLHCHSRWSDGVMSLEELAQVAKAKGYQYVAVCDHSQSLTVANGLSVERLRAQQEEIRKLNERLDSIQLLSGIEVDILADGSLDLPDSVLAERDLVIASIHSGFRQDVEQLTRRVMRAMQNPHVDIIGHPTGRLLGRRDPYAIDMEQVIEMAAKTGTALEINASPDRLDLNDVNAEAAKEAGVKLVINTDAHSQAELDNMHLGLSVARRAWLTKDDVVNTWSLRELRDYFSRKS